jgi:hypothetical protein
MTTNMICEAFRCMLPIFKSVFGEDFITKVLALPGNLKEKAMETISRILELTVFYPCILLIP